MLGIGSRGSRSSRASLALRVGLVAGVIAAAGMLLGPSPASAATKCSYSASSRTATINVDRSATISRTSTSIILINGFPCLGTGLATTTSATLLNTDRIVVKNGSAASSVTIDLSRGPFAKTGNPNNELKWTIELGSGADDLTIAGGGDSEHLAFGTSGVALNADGDADIVTLTGVDAISADGGGGDDALSGQGGSGAGAPFPTALTINGGDGNDTLAGGAGADTVSGGSGNDTLAGGAGSDTVSGGSGNDIINDGAGDDTLSGDAGDDTLNDDDAIGDADVFIGGDDNDTINDGAGDDSYLDGPGNDTFIDGPGNDTYTGAAGANSFIDGPGDDAYLGDLGDDRFEDDDVIGDADVFTGGDGNDTVIDGAGCDTYEGGDGDDTFFDGPGGCDVYHGGDGTDTWISEAGLPTDLEYGNTGDGIEVITYEGVINNSPGLLDILSSRSPAAASISALEGDGTADVFTEPLPATQTLSQADDEVRNVFDDATGAVAGQGVAIDALAGTDRYEVEADGVNPLLPTGATGGLVGTGFEEISYAAVQDNSPGLLDILSSRSPAAARISPVVGGLVDTFSEPLPATQTLSQADDEVRNVFDAATGAVAGQDVAIDALSGADLYKVLDDGSTPLLPAAAVGGVVGNGFEAIDYSAVQDNSPGLLDILSSRSPPAASISALVGDGTSDVFTEPLPLSQTLSQADDEVRNVFDAATGALAGQGVVLDGTGGADLYKVLDDGSTPLLPTSAIGNVVGNDFEAIDYSAVQDNSPGLLDILSSRSPAAARISALIEGDAPTAVDTFEPVPDAHVLSQADDVVRNGIDAATGAVAGQGSSFAVGLGDDLYEVVGADVSPTQAIGGVTGTGFETISYAAVRDNSPGLLDILSSRSPLAARISALDDGGSGPTDTFTDPMPTNHVLSQADDRLEKVATGTPIVADLGAGHDTFVDDTAADTALLGPGNDVLVAAPATQDLAFTGTTLGGDGVDSIDASQVVGEFPIDFATDVAGTNSMAIPDIEGGQGNDAANVFIGDEGPNEIEGGGGNDTIHGGGGNDLLRGGDGDDQIFGGNGEDTIEGDEGNDRLDGQNGVDQLFGGAGNDVIADGANSVDFMDGGEGDDRIWGGRGDDVIVGGPGNDVLVGEEGNDQISGGDGNDEIFGGQGNDLLSGDAGDDFLQGGDNPDQIDGGADFDTWVDDGQDTAVNVEATGSPRTPPASPSAGGSTPGA